MTRNGANTGLRELAQKLVDHELSLLPASADDNKGKQRVIERLLSSLVPLVGRVGFCSLLARALTLAKREYPALREVRVREDCTLEGLPDGAPDAVGVLILHLIGLMTTLMGETLTLRLLRNAWPELPTLQQSSVEQSKHE